MSSISLFTMQRLYRTIALFAVVLMVGCSEAAKDFPSLVDKGIMGLSSSDPYLGPNLFLSGELEKSTFLFNFFKSRGAPAAIEITQPNFSATQVLFYYPDGKEVYKADFREKGLRHEWIIRGPYTLTRDDYRALSRIQVSLSDVPVFVLYGKQYRFHRESTFKQQTARVLRPSFPEYTLPPKTVQKKKTPKKPQETTPQSQVETKPATEPKPVTAATQVPGVPLTLDQKAILISKGYAPRADNGDILHPVKTAEQNLGQIAKWYTGSEANKDAIAKENALSPDAALPVGSKIRVPAALVKETKLFQP